jgi:UDP-N-acetylmuramoyl-tripeptide--D-alanyl-D-alanine ligase
MKQEAFRPVLSPSFVAHALGLTLPGVLSTQAFSSVASDSRKIQPGCLFVALRGEKFDGHDFILQAIEGGARGVICRRDFARPAGSAAKFFPVEDTLAAYRRLAGAWRREYPIPVVAVAGSVGKTTTKELLTAILRGKWDDVLKTQGSQNGFVGIPLTLLELTPPHGAAVIEVGIDETGAMEKHIQLVQPSVAVLTAIGPEHLEKLHDIPTVAREEGLALSHTV